MSEISEARESEVASVRQPESEDREAPVMAENIHKEDAEAEKLLHLASSSANFLSNITVQGFRETRDRDIYEFLNTYMNGVPDVLAQADSAPTCV